MPRAPTITFDDVCAIADRLQAAGARPNPRLILEHHGSGSLGTIHPLFKRWEAEARHESKVGAGLALSPALQRAILEFMGQEIAHARADLETGLADSEQRAADLARENARQAADIEDKAELLAALQAEAAAQQGKLDQIEADLAGARDDTMRERAAAETARTELAKERLRLEVMPRLESELAAVRAEFDAERRARITAEQAAAVLAAQKDSYAERLVEEKERTEQAAALLSQEMENGRRRTVELTSARVAVEAGNARLEAASRELDGAKEAAQAARAEARKAIEQSAELRGVLGTGRP
ncbi:colicin import membrane protein [Oxalobacteraceae bacterium GrIS 1.11]